METYQTIFLILYFFFYGGITYRIRGASKDTIGTQAGRMIWAVSGGLHIWGFNDNFALGLISTIALWIGTLPGYFGGGFDLALAENRTFKNYTLLNLRSCFFVLPLAIVLALLSLTPYYHNGIAWGGVAAGLLFVPCYFAGILIEKKMGIPFPVIGDFLIGGFILNGIAFTLCGGLSCF